MLSCLMNHKFIQKDQAQAQGWDKANKLEGRKTAQGLIGVQVNNAIAVMVEMNCETDFVARNKQFLSLLQTVIDLNLSAAIACQNTLEPGRMVINQLSGSELEKIPQDDGKSLADLVALNIGQLGENICLKRAVHFICKPNGDKTHMVGFTHPSGDIRSLSFGRYGVLMAIEKDLFGKTTKESTLQSLGQQLCQHVVGMNPESVGNLNDRTNWPDKTEKSAEAEPITDGQEEGHEILPSESDLTTSAKEMIHQPFLFDTDSFVRDVLIDAGLDIKGFVRFEVGQDMEK